jgi:murein DD-endopeptidase MepM/ murein hydrolase activator NlpD
MPRTALGLRRRRGKHAAPPRYPHALPTLLLTVPAASIGGLALDGPTAAGAGLLSAQAAQAAPSPLTGRPVAALGAGRPVTVVGALRAAEDARAPAAKPQAAPAAAKKAAPARPAERASRSGREWVSPLVGRLTSGYGRRWGRQHAGIDVAAPVGVPVRAAAAGQVILAGWGGGYGNLVRIRHADGTVSAYAHLSRILTDGGRVAAGEIIGRVGNTGRSTGPHLHFEVRVNNSPLDPVRWLRDKGVRG